ncbi:MAG: 30S ribosomal protein S6 [uncultured bacterium]|nr:MAG: 30S ribosomal protein S6 [uncultured bacterium]
MNRYELMYIISPKVAEEDMRPLTDQIQEMVKSAGGKIIEEVIWGKKKLAYPIKQFRHGYYYILHFELDPEELKKFNDNLKLVNEILRHLTIKLDKKALAAIAEQKKRQEEKALFSKTSEEEKKAVTKEADAAKKTLKTKEKIVKKKVSKPDKKEENLATDEKKEKAKLDELDKKLDQILDEDIVD